MPVQAARNLMGAVVLVVKASYVASRLGRGAGLQQRAGAAPPSPALVWKLRTPEKLPLVRREPPDERRARVRRGASTKQVTVMHHCTALHCTVQASPSKALSEFEQRRLSLSSCSSTGSVCSSLHVPLVPASAPTPACAPAPAPAPAPPTAT